jgi:hypothetical protein
MSAVPISETDTLRGDQSGKRDSGISLGRSVLSALGSSNGRTHSRKASAGSSARSVDLSFMSNGSTDGKDLCRAGFDGSER